MASFAALQSQLGAALTANTVGSSVPHVVVALPSFSLGESLLSHYADRIPALEHRYLLATLLLPRIESCDFVFVTCEAPSPDVLHYYLSLVPADHRVSMKARFRLLEVPDRSARPVAAKLLDRPDLIDDLRSFVRGRPALIEPWNVTSHEIDLARRLGLPINGSSPDLRGLGFKSVGRRLFAEAGVPVPYGLEDVRSVDGVIDAVAEIKSVHPAAAGVVVKTEDSGAGDGNRVIRFDECTTPGELRAIVEAFPDWYLADLAGGGVVEELVVGAGFSSPSVQVDIRPDAEAVVLATHEQVLGGPTGQVYTGCRFPADQVYAGLLGRYGQAVGNVLARRGAIGRFSVDFAAARSPVGEWIVLALEINLPKGGTTHPYAALRHLAPGHYDVSTGQWITVDGSPRSYESTDNLVDPTWQGCPPSDVIGAVAEAGLQFDPHAGTGVVLHMLSCLAVDGRFGLTAIGTSPDHAAQLYAATAAVVSVVAARTARP